MFPVAEDRDNRGRNLGNHSTPETRRCMQLGIHFMNFSFPPERSDVARTIAETAKVADDSGAAWFTFMDHYFQMEHMGGPEAPMLEGYTALGYVAALTQRVKLGLMVTGVTYRHPGLLAKTVTTLDVLSGGRAMLGLGAAWYEREHLGLGVPFPRIGERFERLGETLQIVQQMWSENDGPYDGKHYRLAETINLPQPIQRRPTILIGGAGEKKTLKLVARYADAYNIFGIGPDLVKGKLDVLARHCEEQGREYSTIQKTILGPDPLPNTDAFLAEMERYAAIGVHHVQVRTVGGDPVAFAEQLGERVIPRLATISA
jgi:F420-dependent oxidoreductase-like protein